MLAANIFQKIIDGDISADLVHQDSHCIAIHDIHPQAPVHVLIIPRKPIRTHADIGDSDQMLMGHLHLVAQRLAMQLGLSDGYRIVVNCNDIGGQTVPHLHVHLLGGREMSWPPG